MTKQEIINELEKFSVDNPDVIAGIFNVITYVEAWLGGIMSVDYMPEDNEIFISFADNEGFLALIVNTAGEYNMKKHNPDTFEVVGTYPFANSYSTCMQLLLTFNKDPNDLPIHELYINGVY